MSTVRPMEGNRELKKTWLKLKVANSAPYIIWFLISATHTVGPLLVRYLFKQEVLKTNYTTIFYFLFTCFNLYFLSELYKLRRLEKLEGEGVFFEEYKPDIKKIVWLNRSVKCIAPIFFILFVATIIAKSEFPNPDGPATDRFLFPIFVYRILGVPIPEVLQPPSESSTAKPPPSGEPSKSESVSSKPEINLPKNVDLYFESNSFERFVTLHLKLDNDDRLEGFVARENNANQ